ncbi:MAG: DUF4623 domain-containing protein, partial [Candidatus Woesearchaeota archaeon]
MKKIVILCLLFLISNNAYSQITTNWEKSSAKNNYPKGFMGTSHTERGFATGKITLNPFTTIMERSGVNKNYPSYLGTANTDRGFAYGFSNNQEKLYVVARKVGTNVFILNAATGDSIGKLNNTGITGGTLPLNDVEVSQDGVIFACNLTVNASTSSFKVYKWNNDNAEPKVVVEYTGLALRFGDKFTVTGNTSDNTVTIWAVAAGNKKVVKFTTTNKGETFTASEINLTGLAVGNSPAIYPDLTANEIYINSNGQPLKRYAMNGTLKDSVPTTIIGTGSNSLRVFYYNNRKFIATYVYGSGNENIRVVEVTDGLINAKLVGVTPSMYSVSNANGVGDIDFKKNSDGTYNLYVLGTNNGIAAYKILPTQYGTFERMYIVSRLSGNKIIALNAETGDSLKVLDVTGIAGGTFLINDAEVAASGEIFACNLTTNASTSPFKFYKWYDESSKPIEVINYNKLALRFGDKFTVTGSSKDNTLTIWAVAASSNKIVKFTTNDNGLTFTPQEITLSDANVLNSPVVYPNYDGTKLYVNSNGTALKEYDNTGKFLDAVPTSIIGTGTNALRYFETEKKKFLAVYTYGSGNENLRIIEITNGLSNAALVATTPSLGNLSNSNGVGDCSFSLNTDGTVNLYILATNNGIASYKFTAPKDVAPPMFTPAPGTYLNSVIVKLSTTVGAKIYYTLDETEPTTNSFLYADSIKITETRTIKAIGVLGSVVSKVASGTYYINKVVPPAQMYTLWQKSQANNNLPKYISKENYERGMTVGTFNGKQRVVLVARWLGPKVILIDPFKGDSLATILPDVNVTGGTFPINFPTLSDDGVLFV